MHSYRDQAIQSLQALIPVYLSEGANRDVEGINRVLTLLKSATSVRLTDRSHYADKRLSPSDLQNVRLVSDIVAYEYDVDRDPGTEHRGLAITHCPRRIALAVQLPKNELGVMSIFQIPSGRHSWAVISASCVVDLNNALGDGGEENTYIMKLFCVLPDTMQQLEKENGTLHLTMVPA